MVKGNSHAFSLLLFFIDPDDIKITISNLTATIIFNPN